MATRVRQLSEITPKLEAQPGRRHERDNYAGERSGQSQIPMPIYEVRAQYREQDEVSSDYAEDLESYPEGISLNNVGLTHGALWRFEFAHSPPNAPTDDAHAMRDQSVTPELASSRAGRAVEGLTDWRHPWAVAAKVLRCLGEGEPTPASCEEPSVPSYLIGLALACMAATALAQAPPNIHSPGCRSADLDESIAACTAMIQSGKETTANLAMAYNVRGHDYVARGLYDQAIPDFDKAIALNSRYAFAYNTRGRAYAAKGLYDRAIADFTQALALNHDFAEIPFNRAAAYEAKGQREPAIADYRAALKLRPDLQDAKDGLARLRAAP